MTQLGLQIVPTMPPREVVETVVAAEDLGYDWCQVADEGLMSDVYAVLGMAAERTSRIRLGAATNGYTRHPGATAAALATVDALSGGRAFVTLVAGGTMVLRPLGIEREAPLAVMAETVQLMRMLWSGEPVTWHGERFRLEQAQLHVAGSVDIPILMAVRGPRLLRLAGEVADGVVLMAKSDLGEALAAVDAGRDGQPAGFTRVYLDRLAYTPEMLDEARGLYSYAVMDAPDRMLRNLGLHDGEIAAIRSAVARGGPAAAAQLVTSEMIEAFQIAGTPEQCRADLAGLVRRHHLDAFMMNVISPGLDENARQLAEVRDIVRSAA